MRLLLAEDDPRLGTSIARGLRDHAYAVDLIVDGRQALTEALITPYDAIILDVMLPTLSGLEVAHNLRTRRNAAPILMLTARDSVADRVSGLDSGADDYLVKPFAFDELLARLRALLRRGPRLIDPIITVGDLTIDTRRQVITCGAKSIAVTTKEYALLEFLARNAERPGQCDQVCAERYDNPCKALENRVRMSLVRRQYRTRHSSRIQAVHL